MTLLSDLQERLRRNLQQIPGYAGGNLQDQLSRDQTRPRRTYNTSLPPEDDQAFAQWKQQNAPNDSGADYDLHGAYKARVTPDAVGHMPDTFKKPNHPTFSNESQYAVGADAANAGRWQGQTFVPPDSALADRMRRAVPEASPEAPEAFGSSGEAFMPTRDRRTQPRDMLADDSAYLRDLINQPRNKKDIAMDVIDAVSVAGFGNKPRTTQTKRERDINRAYGQIKLQGDVAKIEQGGLVPVTLNDGRVVMTPAKQAGTLTSQQQGVAQRGRAQDTRDQIANERIKRWDSLSLKERQAAIVSQYKAGLLNNDPEALEQAARDLKIPGKLLPSFIAGQMRDAIDDEGNLIQINRQTGETTNVTRDGKQVASYATTLEGGRDRRAAAHEKAATARAEILASRSLGKDEQGQLEKSAAIIEDIEFNRSLWEDADALLTQNPKATMVNSSGESVPASAVRDQAQRSAKASAERLNRAFGHLFEAGEGERGLAYYKPKGQVSGRAAKSGRTLDGAVNAFKKKVGREPTAEEVARMKAALEQ